MKRILNTVKANAANLLLFVLVLGAALQPVPALAWWNGDWTARAKITLDTTSAGANINDPIGSVPVLVRLHSGNFQFDKAKQDGSDIRFLAGDDKTPLRFHIEKFDSLLGEALVWVNVPDLPPGAKTDLYVYYGNAKANGAEDAKGTYDASTVLVWHFGEKAGPAQDTTRWGNNAQNAGLPDAAAVIGGGIRLDGQTQVRLPASASLAWRDGQALTWALLVNSGPPQPGAVLFSRRDGANAFVIGFDNGVPFVSVTGPAGTQRATGTAPVAANSWHLLTVAASAGRIALYLDRDQVGTVAASIPALTSPAVLGGDSAGAPGFTGQADELEIANVARSAGTIAANAVSQGSDNSKFESFANDEDGGGSWLPVGLLVILKSISVDGWIVIGILTVMLVVCLVLMVDKTATLLRVLKGNRLFQRKFEQLSSDLTALDHDEAVSMGGLVLEGEKQAIGVSPLFQIYHVGSREIAHRATVYKNFASSGLSAESLAAIRASMDGKLIRELQSLRGMMVVLSISIAGAPFIGLLGTVVGVMNTFAGIGASGSVDIESVAPGMSSALMATAFGLGVAVPALFAYNIFQSVIKNMRDEMQIFVDEFVTKMAEFYRPEIEALPEAQMQVLADQIVARIGALYRPGALASSAGE